MKKRKKIIIFITVSIITVLFSTALTIAFIPGFDTIGKYLGSKIPQPTYSIWDGLEKDKMEKMILELTILNNTLIETEKQTQYQIDAIKLLTALLGNSQMVREIDRSMKELMPFDWINISFTDILKDLLGKITEKGTEANVTLEQEEKICHLHDAIAGVETEKGQQLTTTQKAVIKKQIEDDYLIRLAGEVSSYAIDNDELVLQDIENNMTAFINDKQQVLQTIEKQLDIAEETDQNSLMKQMKYNNRLLILNAQIQLKMLASLSLMNEANYIELVNTREERLKSYLESE